MSEFRRRRVLLISSGGGHWVQLLRLQSAWTRHEAVYVTVQAHYAEQVPGHVFHTITDATRWDRWRIFRMVVEVAVLVLRLRPDVIVTTGAAPGVVALRVGKWLGASTVWIDSIANVEAVSLSGIKVRACADLWLTQWEHLARPEGPYYTGSVL